MTDEIAEVLRRNWAKRDRHQSVLLDTLDEHLPMSPLAKPVSPGVAAVPMAHQPEQARDMVLFPVYSLVPRPVNLASYNRESP